jgi:2-polyprenyl-6-methoxyphenol hydroxylase-like FAD-dependent oxidoreductase
MTKRASPAALPVETDVLIVGAGPTGLALAVSLAELGIDHVVVEREPEPHTGSRAAGMQPRTLEYLDCIGAAEGLVAAGLQAPGIAIKDGDRTLIQLSYAGLDTPFPFILLVPQRVTEMHLERRLNELGGTVHRGQRLIGAQREHPGALATLAGHDGALRAIQARYLVGCDGVHSTVRHAAGIPFPGTAPEPRFALADVRIRPDREPARGPHPSFFLEPDGVLVVLPLPGGVYRIVAPVPADAAPPSADDLDAMLAAHAEPGLGRMVVTEVVASSTYRVQERVAPRLSDGPMFLAGDAAHTHSPIGGQGMNTGIQDAANLAWKLHEVIARGAPPQLLDSYHRERRPVAAAVVAFTAQLLAVAMIADPGTRAVRNEMLAAATPKAVEWLAVRLAQLAVSYTDAPPGPVPRPGQRVAPGVVSPSGLSWILALPATRGNGHQAERQVDRLAVRVVDGLETTLLVRPDGYLAADGVPRDPHAVLGDLHRYAAGFEPAVGRRPHEPAGAGLAARGAG